MALPSYPLRIVTGQTMAAVDRNAIEHRGVAGLYLMERAGEGVVQGLLSLFSPQVIKHTAIVCGKGNNGGDGFVVSRRLEQMGLSPFAALIGNPDELKGDALTQYRTAKEAGVSIYPCLNEEDLRRFFQQARESQIWIDALLGTGTRGAPRGPIQRAVQCFNRLPDEKWVISIDISSGVDADTGRVEGDAVEADWVFSVGLPKVGHALPPGLDYYRQLRILDIGFPADLLQEADSEAEWVTPGQVNAWLPRRRQNAHKGSEGHLLVFAGSRGMTGAALMCAQAAIRQGVGLLTAVCPASLLPIYACSVWEKLTLPAPESEAGSLTASALDSAWAQSRKYSAVVIGPGLSRHPDSLELVRRVVREVEVPVLIDGDGLAALTPDDLRERKYPWVVTPHPGEMAMLFQTSAAEVQANRWKYARLLAAAAQEFVQGFVDGVVALKGAKTVIAQQDRLLLVNPTGGPYMASGGMGDVLAGMIGALLAKGIPPRQAAAAGVYLHGLAADTIAEETGAEAVSATETIGALQKAVGMIRGSGYIRPGSCNV